MNTKRILLTFLTILLITFGIVSPVAAHGENAKLEYSRIEVGPYLVSIWSAPTFLRAGDVRFETLVTDADYVPVLDSAVDVVLTSLDSDIAPIHLVSDSPTASTNYSHEANHVLTEPGRYNVAIIIQDETGEVGRKEFEVEIVDVPLWIKVYMYLSLLATAVLGLSMLIKGLLIFGLWQPAQKKRRVVRRPAG